MSSQIILSTLQMEPTIIEELTQLSRDILHANGNRSWNKKIHLITDDVDIAKFEIKAHGMKDISSNDFLGYCWGNGGNQVIWVKPRGGMWVPEYRSYVNIMKLMPHRWNWARHDEVKTLCHEVAHALTANICHNHTWRRTHALLLPFWLKRLYDPVVNWDDLKHDVRQICSRYRRSYGAVGREAELERHMQAIDKTWTKWSPRVI